MKICFLAFVFMGTCAYNYVDAAEVVAEKTNVEVPRLFVVYHDVMVPMLDGVRLATDIYVPSHDSSAREPSRYPVLLLRTPYGKKHFSIRPSGPIVASAGTLSPDMATRNGYVVVYQDVRGTFDSGGNFEPMLNEADDGLATVEWLRAQPWSDGRIGTFGPSYMGGDQMLLAAKRPRGLVTAFSQVAATDLDRNEWVYVDGVFVMTAARWTLQMVGGAVSRLSEPEQNLLRADYASIGVADRSAMKPANVARLLSALPLAEMPIVRRAPWWHGWLKNWNNPDYFKKSQMRDRYENVAIPILHLGGWYDLFLRNTYEQFENISARAKDLSVRANQRLVIGPWSHGTCIGFPSNANVDSEAMQLAWMDWSLKGKKDAFFDHPVTVYVMGENRWRSEESWPLVGTVKTRYYLHSAGHANTANGNGELSTTYPASEKPDQFNYNPASPAPTLGGIGYSGSRALENEAETRLDVLAYTSPILAEEVEVTGEVAATLYAASSATDTDWWIKLVDVGIDGKAEILDQGVVRARYRRSRTNPEPLIPKKIERYEVNMWATSNVFKAGHRIRVEVSSSNFPYADRNPNAFVDLAFATEKDFVIASQKVYHEAEHPSFVELPIIPLSRRKEWIETPFPQAIESLSKN